MYFCSYRAFVDLGKRLQDPPVHAALLVGGIKPTETVKMLNQNLVDVLVGTPPIIASYMKSKKISSTRCRFFVLDEADELISNDSVDHIKSIYGRLLASTEAKQSRYDRLQVCFFSATLHSKEVRDLAETLCHKPLWVDLRGQNDSILPETVHHCVVNISPSAKRLEEKDLLETDAVHRNGTLSAKVELDKLESEKARDSECVKQLKPRAVLDVMEKFSMEQVLIFCRTNLDCDLMEKFFKQIGGAGGMGTSDKYSCRVLAGMRSMDERQKSLEAFKEGEVRILICTGKTELGVCLFVSLLSWSLTLVLLCRGTL
jgi:ATP-dependent RNA helicase DDX1